MSDTRRWIQPGWDNYGKPKSKKHQSKDRKPFPKGHRFAKGTRNSAYNLLKKVDALRFDEEFNT
jgi:hypothetical protein